MVQSSIRLTTQPSFFTSSIRSGIYFAPVVQLPPTQQAPEDALPSKQKTNGTSQMNSESATCQTCSDPDLALLIGCHAQSLAGPSNCLCFALFSCYRVVSTMVLNIIRIVNDVHINTMGSLMRKNNETLCLYSGKAKVQVFVCFSLMFVFRKTFYGFHLLFVFVKSYFD